MVKTGDETVFKDQQSVSRRSASSWNRAKASASAENRVREEMVSPVGKGGTSQLDV